MILDKLSFEELEKLYNQYFSIGNLNVDINSRFALISLICYTVKKLKEKKPDITYYHVIQKLAKEIPEDQIKGLAIMCSDFAYGCEEFPTFGVKDKKIPAQIKEILSNWLPF